MPKLSIGIPVFNGQEFLPELLDSLLAQTFRDFEILICDNASSDRTPQICCEYERRDSRVRYIRNERNLGAIANFNRVFELSTAPLFKWAAHDDLYHEAYLDACVTLLEENPDIILAHTGTAFIDEKSEILPFEQETGSFIDPRTGRRYWADVPSIGDLLLPPTDFGRCSRVPAGGPICLALSAVRSCSKRLSCPILSAVIVRCWQNWLCLAVSVRQRELVPKTPPCQRFLGS